MGITSIVIKKIRRRNKSVFHSLVLEVSFGLFRTLLRVFAVARTYVCNMHHAMCILHACNMQCTTLPDLNEVDLLAVLQGGLVPPEAEPRPRPAGDSDGGRLAVWIAPPPPPPKKKLPPEKECFEVSQKRLGEGEPRCSKKVQ